MDIADFEAGIAKAQALSDRLDGKDVNVKVKADTGAAEAKLATVARAADRVDDSNKRIAKSGRDAGKGMGALATAVITLGPALVPLAVGTVGLAAGFGAMGTAGILAIVGIRKEMQTGTTMGLQYSAQINTLKGNLTQLGRTAAAGTLAPFEASVRDLQRKMPALNAIVGEFGVITGKTAGALTTGLLAAFIALKPLMADVGVYTLGLSTRFAALMSGPGVVSFGDYVRSVFPQVMAGVESIVGAVIHLVAAFAPLGLGTLSVLRTFSDLISAIPVDVLATLATTASSVYLGFKSFGILSVGIRGVGTALEYMGVSAQGAAVGVSALTKAAGVIGVAIAAATFLFTSHTEAARQDQDAVNGLTDALIRGKGAVDAQAVSEQALKLAQDGTLEAAKAAGYAVDDVTRASLGFADASARVTARTNEIHTALNLFNAGVDTTNGKAQIWADNVGKVVDATKNGTTQLGLGTEQYRLYTAALASGASSTGALAAVQQRVADAQMAQAVATAAATQKMHDENDAAGLLKQTLDALNGKALNAANAQNAFDSSLVNMGTHVTATGKKITFSTTSIHDMSSASVALRGQLNGQVENLQRVVEANGGFANSTGKARAQMKTLRQQIIDNAVAHGVNRAAATAYIDTLLKTPNTVTTTAKMDADAAIAKANTLKDAADKAARSRMVYIGAGVAQAITDVASLQARIDRLHGRDVLVSVSTAFGVAMPTSTRHADGSVTGSAFSGAPVQAFAAGGFAEAHVAMIAIGGGSRTWNEPETGGEAYIPLAPSKRARSTAIWEETGRKLGMDAQGGGPIELGPNTIRALGREIARRPTNLDGATLAASVGRRLVPR